MGPGPKFALAAIAAVASGVLATSRRTPGSSPDTTHRASPAHFEPPWKALVQQSTAGTIVLDGGRNVCFASDTMERMLGHPVADLQGNSLEWICHSSDLEVALEKIDELSPKDHPTTDFELRAFDDTATIHILSIVATDLGSIDGSEGVILHVTDITSSRLMEDQFHYAAQNDPLTLLPNRESFLTAVDSAIRRASVNDESVAIAVIDIDDFRVINEGYGASTADQVLTAVALRMRQAISQYDMLSRLGGDEFGILISSSSTEQDARTAIRAVLEVLERVIWVEGHNISVQASAGLNVTDDSDATAQSMLRQASTALDSAKALDRGHIVTFNDAMGAKVAERAELRDLLRVALRNGELRLAYQPILDIDSGTVVSFEALARWTISERGPISPEVFVPIAEASNLIDELGSWALRTACEQVKDWERQGFDDFTVTVNFSGKQLLDPDITDKVKQILTSTGVQPERITIEITESVLIDDTETISNRFQELRSLGLRLAIDDFGTGFSSLSYLRRYEFDVLKIDRSFVIPLGDDKNARDREIVHAMISLSRSLGAVTVAEGIEHESEYETLQALGCECGQGFLFWKPLEAEDVIDVLALGTGATAA